MDPDDSDDEWLCYCFQVKAQQVEHAIRTLGLKTVDEVGAATRAGCGCRTCRPEIEALLAACARGEYKFPGPAESGVPPASKGLLGRVRGVLGLGGR